MQNASIELNPGEFAVEVMFGSFSPNWASDRFQWRKWGGLTGGASAPSARSGDFTASATGSA